MSFKINWTIKQLTSLKGFAAQKSVLKSPLIFYYSLVAKLIPGLYNGTIKFNLKNGYVIMIKEFMSIYIYNEIFVEGCYDNLPIKNKKPMVIEVGANTGFFVLRIKSAFPDSEIISFEPYPPNYNALQETIKLNKIKNIKPLMQAVGDKPGKLKLYIHPTNIGGHSIFKQNAGDNFVEVESTTIDSILSFYKITTCDLLKLDCEGAEYPILKSFTVQTAHKVKNIIYEPTYNQYSVVELNTYLNSLGYNIKIQNGLVVASMEKI